MMGEQEVRLGGSEDNKGKVSSTLPNTQGTQRPHPAAPAPRDGHEGLRNTQLLSHLPLREQQQPLSHPKHQRTCSGQRERDRENRSG